MGYSEARARAEELARLLKLPLVDSTAGVEAARAPGRLDESIRERARREGRRSAPAAAPPPGSRVRVEVDGSTVRLRIPPRGVTVWQAVRMLLFLGLEGVVFAFLVPLGFSAGGAWGWLGAAVIVIAFGVLPGVSFADSFARRVCFGTTVEASPESLRVTTRSLFRREAERMPSDAIEEVLAGDAVMARGDASSISLGAHLSREEKAWLRDVLEGALTA